MLTPAKGEGWRVVRKDTPAKGGGFDQRPGAALAAKSLLQCRTLSTPPAR